MISHNVQNISPSERTERFIDNFKRLFFQLSDDSHKDSVEAEGRMKKIAQGAGQIASPIAFYSMSKALYQRATITMGELTKEILTPPSTANRLVTWCVDRGLAERLSDPNDKRVIRVRMTENGRRLYEAMQEIAIIRIDSLFSKLTPEEATIFNLLLDKLASKYETVPTNSRPEMGEN